MITSTSELFSPFQPRTGASPFPGTPAIPISSGGHVSRHASDGRSPPSASPAAPRRSAPFDPAGHAARTGTVAHAATCSRARPPALGARAAPACTAADVHLPGGAGHRPVRVRQEQGRRPLPRPRPVRPQPQPRAGCRGSLLVSPRTRYIRWVRHGWLHVP